MSLMAGSPAVMAILCMTDDSQPTENVRAVAWDILRRQLVESGEPVYEGYSNSDFLVTIPDPMAIAFKHDRLSNQQWRNAE